MAIETTGVENVMEEVAHFWRLRKFQFIEEATDFWMDAVAPKECFVDEDPDLRTALTLNQFFTEWLLFEMSYQESTLVGITALRDEISAEQRDVLKQIAETRVSALSRCSGSIQIPLWCSCAMYIAGNAISWKAHTLPIRPVGWKV